MWASNFLILTRKINPQRKIAFKQLPHEITVRFEAELAVYAKNTNQGFKGRLLNIYIYPLIWKEIDNLLSC